MARQYKIVKKQSIQALKKYERVLKNYEDTDHKILKNIVQKMQFWNFYLVYLNIR
jgi:hypothetical protein